MAKRLAPSTLATRVRSLASSWAVVRRPVGETPASASPCRLCLREQGALVDPAQGPEGALLSHGVLLA
jgi:hypothetical protein